MKNLSKRANILYRNYKSKDILIYEDHRFAVNVLYYYYLKNGKPLNAFIFDRHCDLGDVSDDVKQYINKNPKPSFQQVSNLVEFKLSEDDNNWCKGAMELQIMNNYYLLFGSIIRDINETNYIDIYNKGHEINYLNSNNIKNLNNECLNIPYSLDFDLDCFSYYKNGKIKGMSLQEIKNHIRYEELKGFYKLLIEKSEFISICFESGHCGGINESRKIFNNINKLFFNNKL